MKNLIFTITLTIISNFAFAKSTICSLEKAMGGIAWDSTTLAAKVTDETKSTHEGRVTIIREHKPYGEKTNIFIRYSQPYYGGDAAEYIVFPTGENEFRVIGVTYIFKDNKYHLNASKGNYSATCLSM